MEGLGAAIVQDTPYGNVSAEDYLTYQSSSAGNTSHAGIHHQTIRKEGVAIDLRSERSKMRKGYDTIREPMETFAQG